MEKKLYTVIHTHRFGVDVYLLRADHLPTIEEAIEAHSIDFERDRDDEWLEIDEAGNVVDL